MDTAAPEIDLATRPSAADDLLNGWCTRLDGFQPRVILGDGPDPRVLAAATQLAELGFTATVVATREQAQQVAATAGVPLSSKVEFRSPEQLAACGAGEVLDRRLAVLDDAAARRLRADPLFLAAGAVAAGSADACVAGCTRPTADVLRAALRVVGKAPQAHCVTSSFLMALGDGRLVAYGDCAVLPEPDAEQLAEVAVATSRTYTTLADENPAVAMLSFSTKGSAEHPGVELVRAATNRVRRIVPGLNVDGELQFDAALLDSVASSKAGDSTVAGRANVFVFPNLAAGNIGYKITERLAGARAYGPILQGLAAPVNDLSRGCTSTNIVNVAAISALQNHAAH